MTEKTQLQNVVSTVAVEDKIILLRGNQVFECWRIENGIHNREITPLDILSFIGKQPKAIIA